MTVKLKEVLEIEKSILRNFYSLYLHELSNFTTNLDVGEDGVFHYEELDKFWDVDGLSPYFIKWDDEIIGFILLLERPFLKKSNDYGINDFFILNKYKGKGLAVQAARKILEEKPGQYFVMQVVENKRAVAFWKKVYNELNIETHERQDLIDDELCLIQTFKV
jgi:predicted acetyltransferase